jgi:NAD(P)-dependent dehydrogenase (short-subunit alcohol dehydrogenase family)
VSEFKGKVALVTGGSAGIGQVTAIAFAKQGAKVAICGRREEQGAEALRRIKDAGSEALFVRCDVSKSADVQAMVRRVEETFGRLDFAFNNAGVGTQYVPIDQQTEEDFDQAMAINLKGVWLSMKYQAPAILRAGGGAIVNNASVGAHIGLSGLAIYNATKHGVIGLTKSAAMDYAKKGLRINSVSPGITLTDMTNSSMGGQENAQKVAALRHPMGRAGEPEEIANAVVWLCSSGSSFMTGHDLALDGGRTATG